MIGIFDSGSGGLTVLRALTDALPERSFVYYGDHARAPYGERGPEDIHRLTRAAIERLFGLGCRLVIVACNTAAATSLRYLQRGWLAERHAERRVLGVLVPVVEAVTGVPWMAEAPVAPRSVEARTVAVFATRRTVDSGAYPLEIAKRAPEVRVVQQACPSLVGLIETGAPRAVLQDAVDGYVAALMDRLDGRVPDAAILGCTHYPLVADLFVARLPASVEVLSQGELAARSLASYLTRHPGIDVPDPVPALRFLTSGEPAPASSVASAFFGRPVTFSAVAES